MELINQNTPYYLLAIIAVALWSIPWKALALWKSARRNHVGWFIFFLLINTAGILEIIYLIILRKKGQESTVKQELPGASKLFHQHSRSDNMNLPYERPQIDTDEYTSEEKEAEHQEILADLKQEGGLSYDRNAFNLRKLRMQKRLEEGTPDDQKNLSEQQQSAGGKINSPL